MERDGEEIWMNGLKPPNQNSGLSHCAWSVLLLFIQLASWQ